MKKSFKTAILRYHRNVLGQTACRIDVSGSLLDVILCNNVCLVTSLKTSPTSK